MRQTTSEVALIQSGRVVGLAWTKAPNGSVVSYGEKIVGALHEFGRAKVSRNAKTLSQCRRHDYSRRSNIN